MCQQLFGEVRAAKISDLMELLHGVRCPCGTGGECWFTPSQSAPAAPAA